MEEILYDIPFEVSEKQYNAISKNYGGVAPHRKDQETGKFYVKLWFMSYKDRVLQCLINNK
jgi:hypothetical protein